jgi:hypothetical protein
MQAANFNAILTTLKLIAKQVAPANNYVSNANSNAVFIGYNAFTVAIAINILPLTLQMLNATNINYNNLFTTNGDEDTTVTFTYNDELCTIVTCYCSL